MELIHSLEEYKNLINTCRDSYGKPVKYGFLMESTAEKYISRKRMYFRAVDNGLILYVDEGSHYNCFLRLSADNPIPEHDSLAESKPLLVELLSSGRGNEDDSTSHTNGLLESGFRLIKENYQYEIDVVACLDRLKEMANTYSERNGLRMCFCRSADKMKEVVSLWDNELDPTDIPEDHRTLDENDNVLCWENELGEIVATEWWSNTKRTSEGRHTVTRADYRRMGLAAQLLVSWCLNAAENGIQKCYTWISKDNSGSIRLHESIGFTCNGRCSKQYIFK